MSTPAINFESIEDALFDLVKASTGFADENIIFSDQDAWSPSPTAYATIYMGDLMGVGLDASKWDYNVSRPVGAEIVRSTVGLRTMPAKLSIYTPETTGSATARTIAAKLQADLALPSIRQALNVAGIGVLKQGDVRWVPKINNSNFEGRAVVEVMLTLAQGSSDSTGYIKIVNITPTINNVVLPVISVDVDDPP